MTLPQGFRFAGLRCGIRGPEDPRLDLALVVSDRPASAAGVFTQNRVCAAPVLLCRQRLPRVDARGIVINSGNANACTGDQGLADAERMAALAAQAVGADAQQFLVCSTGVIGHRLPMQALEPGIGQAVRQLSADEQAFETASRAILTTDTRPKTSRRSVAANGRDYQVVGFAKGAAMIGPNMATMLAFVLTDAPVAAAALAALAPPMADATFNCISVEGHTSTNDTLLFLANGQGAALEGRVLQAFQAAAQQVCGELAQAIAADAEGASHLITIHVEGTRTDAEARAIAREVANSALVKTALFGADPNWGRVVSAAGNAGVPFGPTDLALWLDQFELFTYGTPAPFDASQVSGHIKANRNLTLTLRLKLGEGRCTFYTCDLTHEYIRLNADYTT